MIVRWFDRDVYARVFSVAPRALEMEPPQARILANLAGNTPGGPLREFQKPQPLPFSERANEYVALPLRGNVAFAPGAYLARLDARLAVLAVPMRPVAPNGGRPDLAFEDLVCSKPFEPDFRPAGRWFVLGSDVD